VGGYFGVLLIDPSSGEILAEKEVFNTYDFAGSPDGRFVATVDDFEIRLLSADDLTGVWDGPSDATAYGALAFSSVGESLFALLRTSSGEWLLQVLDLETGEVERQHHLGPTGPYLTWDRKVQPATQTADGRFIVFATDDGAFVVDAVTGSPRLQEREPAAGTRPIGCCSVVATEAGPLFVSGSESGEAQLGRLGIDR
jgi:hypothetical protein